ncbi:TlpA family protein disulfide reductase [Natronococcus wangiae]|uniref:TlpA family protein disulfide reductase n=1 Tax=Natronococcus wangiae TaxID=3068275 RepID=UPI00273FA4F7|nr:redoxin domain-containing protein [Natronococcus sp. AD5]
MKRRELVAGVGSLGVLAGAGALLRRGPPSFEDAEDDSPADDGTSDGPIEVETIEARGSDAGLMTVPSDGVTVLMCFVNACGICQSQVPRLAEARASLQEDHPDDVTFLSVTYDSREQIPPDELRDWWTTHGGNGYVSYDAGELAQRYRVVGYPVTVVVDSDGEEHWRETGTTAASTVVGAVESVLEADAEDGDAPDEENGSEGSDSPGEQRTENETDADTGTESEGGADAGDESD